MRREYQFKKKKIQKSSGIIINQKQKWRKVIRELHIDPDNIRSAKTDDDKEKADILADYFSNVFTKESDGPAPHLENKEIKTKLKNLHIDEEKITKMLPPT